MTPVLQWLNANRYRRYPFCEDLVLRYKSESGEDSIILPDDTLLDMQYVIYRPGAAPARRLELAEIQAEDEDYHYLLFRFKLGDVLFDALPVPCTISTRPMVLEQHGVRIQAVFGADGVSKILQTFKDKATVAPYAADFTAPGHFEPATCIVHDRHRITSLKGDTGASVPVAGDVRWKEGYNTRIDVARAVRRITVLPEPGAGAGQYCERRLPERPGLKDILLAINELYADSEGRLQLTGVNGVSIIPEPEKHRITVKVTADMRKGFV